MIGWTPTPFIFVHIPKCAGTSIEQALKAFTSRSPWDKHPIAFESTGIVQRTQEPLQPFLRHKLVRTDGVSYSIVKFDWDFPPFLRPVNAAMRAAATQGLAVRRRVRSGAHDLPGHGADRSGSAV